MPNKRISELSAAGALSGTELVEIVQGGANVQTTTQDIADLGGGGGGGGSFATITGDPYDNTALAADLRGKSDSLITVDSTHTGNYTLASAELTDVNNGVTLILEGDDTGDLTVPANATVAFPVGAVIGLRGYDNVVEAVGVTVTPTSSTWEIPAGTTATLEKTGTDAWILHNGSADTGGDSKEDAANKATDFSEINDTKFPTTEAVVERLSSRVTKTDDYATVQTDNQKLIVLDAAITKTVTVDQLTADSYISFVNINAGQWNLTAGTGVTLYGSATFLPGGVINSITLWWLSATAVYVISGSSESVNTLSVNGSLAVRAGLSTGIIAKVGGIIYSSITTAGNLGTGEDDLFLYEVPANTLTVDKASLVAYASGTFAANANSKRVRVRFGGTSIFDSGAVALNSGDWYVEVQIFRTASSTQKTVTTFRTSNSTLYTTVDYTTAAVDLTTPLELRVTAEATSNNDVVGELFKVIYQPVE
jgi:hypothetical protein